MDAHREHEALAGGVREIVERPQHDGAGTDLVGQTWELDL
jgi:hypothetical protein